MGPGHYSGIGQRVRDLLYGDYYHRGFNFTITNCSPTGLVTTSCIRKYGGWYFAAKTQFKRNITTDIKVDTHSSLATTIVVDEPMPGFKAILSFSFPYQYPGKLNLQYSDDCAGIMASIGLTKNPIVNISWMIGNKFAAIGSDVAFNIRNKRCLKYNVGLSFSSADHVAGLIMLDKGNELIASYHNTVNPLTNTVVGVEFSHSFSRNENSIVFGTQHSFSPLTKVKARIDHLGNVGSSIQHEWRRNSLLTVSGGIDTKAITKSASFGLALALKL